MPAAERVSARPEPAERAEVLEELWRSYVDRHDLAVRNQLATIYYPLVRNIARMMARSLAGQAGIDDLESYGAEGLLGAIERFDPARGYDFPSFAGYRIRYAILDGVRSADWVPRSVREHERQLRRVEEDSFGTLARPPRPEEEASELGVDLEELRRLKGLTFRTVVSSISTSPVQDEVAIPAGSAHDEDPELAALVGETIELVRAGLATLPERQKVVLTLSLEAGATLAEIGRILGVTESRVCQIRSRGISSLRSYLAAHGVASA